MPIQNNPPIVTDLIIYTINNQKLVIKLSASDVDGDKLSFRIIDPPKHGLIKGFRSSIGSLIFIPQLGFVGEDKFTFSADDGKSNSNIGTVNVRVGTNQKTIQKELQPSSHQIKPYSSADWLNNMSFHRLLPRALVLLTLLQMGRVV